MTRLKRHKGDTSGARNALQDAAATARSDTRSSGQTLELPASARPCPEPCLHRHRLRYPYNLEGITQPDADRAISVIVGEATDDNFGTDCRLCGQFVHMDTWHAYYLRWRREHGLPDLEAGR